MKVLVSKLTGEIIIEANKMWFSVDNGRKIYAIATDKWKEVSVFDELVKLKEKLKQRAVQIADQKHRLKEKEAELSDLKHRLADKEQQVEKLIERDGWHTDRTIKLYNKLSATAKEELKDYLSKGVKG